MEIKSFFFFFHIYIFFVSPCPSFLIHRSLFRSNKVHFIQSNLYPLLFSSITLMVGQLDNFQGLNIHPHPYFGRFFSKISGRPKDTYKQLKFHAQLS